MTYNVHRCVGLDGRHAPARIASVIAACAPDVVALQELDVRRRRTQQVNQPKLLADALGMSYHFQSALRTRREEYGEAILSRLPMAKIHCGHLPMPGHLKVERRCALWVSVSVGCATVQIVNTHFGLNRGERRLQADTLLGPEWLGAAHCTGPKILCGDLNLTFRSPVYARIARALSDVQPRANGHPPRRTWPSLLPLVALDHVFVSPDIRVRRVEVPRSRQGRIASDHLPVVADLEF